MDPNALLPANPICARGWGVVRDILTGRSEEKTWCGHIGLIGPDDRAAPSVIEASWTVREWPYSEAYGGHRTHEIWHNTEWTMGQRRHVSFTARELLGRLYGVHWFIPQLLDSLLAKIFRTESGEIQCLRNLQQTAWFPQCHTVLAWSAWKSIGYAFGEKWNRQTPDIIHDFLTTSRAWVKVHALYLPEEEPDYNPVEPVEPEE